MQSFRLYFFAAVAGLGLATISIFAYSFGVKAVHNRGSAPAGANALVTAFSSGQHSTLREELDNRFKSFLTDRSRHNKLLLREIISVYMRTDPMECMSFLRSRNAMVLISGAPLDQFGEELNFEDFGSTLKLASQFNGRIGDELIKRAFQTEVESDPAEAFQHLKYLPPYMFDSLSQELARKWGEKDGHAAAEAFWDYDSLPSRYAQFSLALQGWKKSDPEGEHKYLSSLASTAPGSWGQLLVNAEVVDRAGAGDPVGALRAAHDSSPFNHPPFGSYLGKIYRAFGKYDPQSAIKASNDEPGSVTRTFALQAVADSILDQNPALSMQTAATLPDSQDSLSIIQKAASKLADNSEDPYSIPSQQTDPYQRQAAVRGVTDALYRKGGTDGLANVVQQAISTNETDWLDSAASVIVATTSHQSQDNPLSNTWKALPKDITATLIQYVDTYWSPDEAASFKAKLQ